MLGLGLGITKANAPREVFNLSDNANLQIWLKFNTEIVESGGSVIRWGDSSGNGNNADQTTPANRPKTSSGYVIFDGADDQLDFTLRNDQSITAMTALDLTAGTLSNEVVIGNSNAAWALKLYRGGGSDDVGLRINGNTAEPGSAGAHVDKQLSTGALPSGVFLFTVTYDGTNGNVAFRVDGTEAATGTFGGSTFNPFRLQQMGYGTSGVSGPRLNANVYELAYYNAVLTGDDLTNAENDIKTRTGI